MNNQRITEIITLFERQLTALFRDCPQTRKLILHVGTPKTGTTSVQRYLEKKQRKLRNMGVLYPLRFHNPQAPKHQWFERNLLEPNVRNLVDNFSDIRTHIEPHTHTILLSSEGIYNHWWDFNTTAKALLKVLKTSFEVEVWVWFREPWDFAQSLYKQCLRNPRVADNPCYGHDMRFTDALAEPWFAKRLDYLEFVAECDALFGKEALSIFYYQDDTVASVSQLLGLDTPHDNPTPKLNPSYNAITAELLRVLNRYDFTAKEKQRIIPALRDLDAALTPLAATYAHKRQSHLDDAKTQQLKKAVEALNQNSLKKLQSRFRVII